LCSECDIDIGEWHNRFIKEKFDDKKWKIVDDKFVERVDI